MSEKRSTTRDIGIDLARSTYITMMILYHSFTNVYSISTSKPPDITAYLGLVSGSFPFLAGFLIGNHYLSKIASENNGTSIRLALRGARLLLIYLFANIITLYALRDLISQPLVDKTTNPMQSILMVNASHVVFDILVPLGLILIVGALLARLLNKASRENLNMLSLVVGLSGIALAIDGRYLFMACGLIGIALGHHWAEKHLDGFYKKHRVLILLSLAYGLLFALLTESPKETGPFYVIGVVTLFYAVRNLPSIVKLPSGFFTKELTLYSKYSLLIYLTHVPLLLFLVNQPYMPVGSMSFFTLLLTLLVIVFISMSLLIRFTEYMRASSQWVQKAYVVLFG